MKCWEIVANQLSKAEWSLGWVSAVGLEGRTIWIVDAHGCGKRFIVRADEIVTAFAELERAIHEFAVSLVFYGRAETARAEKLTAFLELEAAIRARLNSTAKLG